eukprot:1179902-Prorocentrum_minimum.AAC.2
MDREGCRAGAVLPVHAEVPDLAGAVLPVHVKVQVLEPAAGGGALHPEGLAPDGTLHPHPCRLGGVVHHLRRRQRATPGAPVHAVVRRAR